LATSETCDDPTPNGGIRSVIYYLDSRIPRANASDDAPLWECIGSKTCGEPCHLPSSAGNTVTVELATVNDENPCGDRGLDAVCPPVAIDGTDGEKWRRRESNPQVQSRNSQVATRLWHMLQDVGVSWEWKDDANRHPCHWEEFHLFGDHQGQFHIGYTFGLAARTD
jgi:hypothetical protein